jgi:ribosomal protein S15P/S13E
MNEEKFTVEQVAKALRECEGFQASAADKLGCTEETIVNYKHRHPELAELVKHLKEKHKDYAEGRLLTHIKDGKETSLIFYLKTQCRERGYVEKQEIEHSGMVKIDTVIDAMSEAERKAFIQSLTGESESDGTGTDTKKVS